MISLPTLGTLAFHWLLFNGMLVVGGAAVGGGWLAIGYVQDRHRTYREQRKPPLPVSRLHPVARQEVVLSGTSFEDLIRNIKVKK